MKFDFNSVEIENVSYEGRGKQSPEYLGMKNLLLSLKVGQSFAIPLKFRNPLGYCMKNECPEYKVNIVKTGEFIRAYRIL